MKLILKTVLGHLLWFRTSHLPLAFISGIVELYHWKEKEKCRKNLKNRNENPVAGINFFLFRIMQNTSKGFANISEHGCDICSIRRKQSWVEFNLRSILERPLFKPIAKPVSEYGVNVKLRGFVLYYFHICQLSGWSL